MYTVVMYFSDGCFDALADCPTHAVKPGMCETPKMIQLCAKSCNVGKCKKKRKKVGSKLKLASTKKAPSEEVPAEPRNHNIQSTKPELWTRKCDLSVYVATVCIAWIWSVICDIMVRFVTINYKIYLCKVFIYLSFWTKPRLNHSQISSNKRSLCNIFQSPHSPSFLPGKKHLQPTSCAVLNWLVFTFDIVWSSSAFAFFITLTKYTRHFGAVFQFFIECGNGLGQTPILISIFIYTFATNHVSVILMS